MSDSFSPLTLNEPTLFYWMLSNTHQTRDYDAAINKWADPAGGVPSDLGPALSTSSYVKANPASHPGHSKPRVLPHTSRPTSAPSIRVVRENAMTVSHGSAASANIQDEASEKSAVISDGGLSDYDETNGAERLAAVNSPLKGKRRVNSEVCLLCSLCYSIITIIPNPARCSSSPTQ